jgi:tetratricopeptide (TPR) repeat protein
MIDLGHRISDYLLQASVLVPFVGLLAHVHLRAHLDRRAVDPAVQGRCGLGSRDVEICKFHSDLRGRDAAIAAYTEAIRLDPHYALAFAARSIAFSYVAGDAVAPGAREGFYDKAQADAHHALALAPDLAQAHLALAYVSEQGNFDFAQASEAYARALALAPGNAQVLRLSGISAALMGRFDAGVAIARRAVVLDPRSARGCGSRTFEAADSTR